MSLASERESAVVARVNGKPIPPAPPCTMSNTVRIGDQVFVRHHAETWTKDLQEYEWATLIRISRRMDLPLEILGILGVAE